MGKWTAGTCDDVLGAKMKSLVTGAIKRSRLEKTDPTISYETFVEDLDGGDSFTSTVIDILVKELAERRSRQNTADRHLIAERTARSLRSLSSPARVYREHSYRSASARRAYTISPRDELDLDEELEDLMTPYDPASDPSLIEGARLNADLYEAYAHHPPHWVVPTDPYSRIRTDRPPATTPSGAFEVSVVNRILPPLQDPPSTRNSWSLPSASGLLGTSLARQSAVRRPTRTRTIDFHEFTSRRRSTTRQNAQETENPRPEASGSTALETSPSSTRRALSPEGASPSGNPPWGRRFFPASRSRRYEVFVPTTSQWVTAMSDETSFPVPTLTPVTSHSPQLPPPVPETSEERSQAPRLRRGGLRAPESLLSRYASPSPFPSEVELPLPVAMEMRASGVAEMAAQAQAAASMSPREVD